MPWVRRFRVIVVLLSAVSSARSEISNAQVLGVSNVQALIGFSANVNADCQVKVSESASFDPLVNDLNPGLFVGSDSAARAGNIVGDQRIVVVGKRGVE